MEKYRRVPAPKEDAGGDPTAVRVQVHGKIVNYVASATSILAAASEENARTTIIGRGRAINKAVTVAEVLRRKMPLHQVTTLSSVTITDHYEPLEEGLDPIENTRVVSCITIDLAKSAALLDTSAAGYALPLSSDEGHLATDNACAAMDAADRAAASRGGRGRGRGGRARAPRGRGASRANGHAASRGAPRPNANGTASGDGESSVAPRSAPAATDTSLASATPQAAA